MNIDRLTTIAEWLEAGAPRRDGVDGFDMRAWRDPFASCGTTCCIAGAAVEFFGNGGRDDIAYTAARLLGLEELPWMRLFIPAFRKARIGDITPAWAARCIRKLIATGEVDWEGTRGEPA